MNLSKALYYFFMLLALCLLNEPVLSQSFFTRHYTIADGLPHNIVYSTFQDSDGFIWLCTDDGLARFDGKNMKVYRQNEGLKSNFVINIAEGANGRKYIATWKGGVHILDGDSAYKANMTNEFDNNTSYVAHEGDSVLFGWQSYVFILGKKKGGIWESEAYWPSQKGNHLIMTPNKESNHVRDQGYKWVRPFKMKYFEGKLYVFGKMGGLWIWDRKKTELQPVFESYFNNREVNAFHVDQQGNKWLGFKGEIVKVTPNGDMVSYKNIPDEYIQNIFTDRKGKEIGFNTSKDKLAEDNIYLLNLETEQLTDLKQELGFVSSPTSLFFDKDGNYWVTTIGEGVYWVLNRPYDYYSFKDIDAKFVYNIIQAREEGIYWLATKSGGFRLNHNNRKITEYLRAQLVRHVFLNPSSKEPFFGSLSYTHRGKEPFTDCIFQGNPINNSDSTVIGIYNKGIIELNVVNGNRKELGRLELRGTRRIRQLLKDKNTLWAASEDGLWELSYADKDTLLIKNHYTPKNGLPNERCYDVKINRDGQVYVGTEEGVVVLKNGRFKRLEQFPITRCLQLLFDHRNNLWVSTTNGLLYYDGKSHIPFQEETGLLANDVTCMMEDDNQQLWIGSSKGITILDNNSFPKLSSAPLLRLIPPKTKTFTDAEKIRMDFSAINYESPKSTVYRYRLNKDTWQTTTNPFVEYNALPANHYQFDIQAKKVNSVWGPSHTFRFQTKAAWYFQWWAIAIEILLFVFVVLWIARARIRQANAVSNRLRKEIDQRILMEKQLAEVRNQIARDFHDEMGNKLASITVLSNLIGFKLVNPKPDIAELLDKIEQSSKQLYRGTKDFIWSIDTKSDNVMELFTYLRDFGESFYQPLEIDFYVETNNLEQFEVQELPLHWSRQIVLIFKEAMTNVAKYAQCSAVWFSFGLENDCLSIFIKDNGKGFDVENGKKGNGLRNMVERSNKIGCDLVINSSEEGTIINFEGKVIV